MDSIIGKKLDGRYEIQEIIGVGGMAVVYKAYDCIDDRTVAVKILKEEFLSNEEFRRRFKNESKAVAVLSHPNIVKVYDVSFGEKMQYIVMEYIDGITLKEYIDQKKVLTWKEAIHFTVQILRALQHAHSKGIVHRDIKPQNIMMLEDGTIKVTDFGIARFAHSETRTMTDKAIGSVHYISPEQARGGFTDEKSDIYSVGVMLYEMLTGTLPFEADSAVSVAIMQLQQNPKRPREINPEIPEGLEEITLRAMKKDPAQRYQSAEEMLSDIEQFKKNPSIHFAYKYFVDESPTRYVDAINKIKHNDEDALQGEKKKKKTPVIPILSGIAAALLLMALIAVFAALYLNGFFPGGRTSDVAVPNLVGKKYDDVMANPTYNKEFKIVKLTDSYSSQYATGVIRAQDPAASTSVKSGSTIKVTVSIGQNKLTVPTVAGSDQAQAQTTLTNAGFTNVSVSKMYSADVAKGLAIKTDPDAGSQAAASDTITLYVSNGPDPGALVTVPDLSGKTADVAKSLLESAGLKLGNTTTQSSDKTAGTVVSQSPASGTQLASGKTVDIVLSAGQSLVTVPDFTKYTASNLPKTTGITVSTNTKDWYAAAGTVISQDVAAGTQVASGTTVTLQIASGYFTVPNVANQTVAQARQTLQNAGFQVQTSPASAPDTSVVASASPAEGSRQKYGSSVTLNVQ